MLGVLVTMVAAAQSTTHPPRQWFSEGGNPTGLWSVVWGKGLTLAELKWEVPAQGKAKAAMRNDPLPSDCTGITEREDGTWVAARKGVDRLAPRLAQSRDRGATWEDLGRVNLKIGAIWDLIALGNDRVVLQLMVPHKAGSGAGVLVIARRNEKGDWDPEAPLQGWLSSALTLREDKPFWPREWEDAIWPTNLALQPIPGGRFLVVHRLAAKVDVYHREDGRHIRTLDLLGVPDPQAGKVLEPAVLGLAPLRSGGILIATRTREAVVEARALFPDQRLEPEAGRVVRGNPEAGKPFLDQAIQAARSRVQAFPGIRYWRWEGGDGGFRPEDPPSAPPVLKDWKDLQAYSITATSDGGVRFP